MVNGPEIARRFHDVYERNALALKHKTPDNEKIFDPNTPYGDLMNRTAQEVCSQIQTDAFHEGYQQGLADAVKK